MSVGALRRLLALDVRFRRRAAVRFTAINLPRCEAKDGAVRMILPAAGTKKLRAHKKISSGSSVSKSARSAPAG